MFRRFIFVLLMMTMAVFAGFGQASALRDYVGMISQTFHPDIVSFMEEFKSELVKRGYGAASRAVDNYLKGESGTGFVYVTGGRSYILTNYHVISQANTLSVTFEKPDGERTRFSDLTIVAGDEEMDIALLAFAQGQNPFREGLAFFTRTINEGDDVYSAGFPGLGNTMVWQLGRGMISNASVRLPESADSDKMIGPFIQHTAQIDPGNSGGPLLVQTQGVPTGFAVIGINTRSARGRQAANFSIPLNRVQAFLNASLRPQPRDELAMLNARVASFIEGLGANRAVYTNIAPFISNNCVGENAEFALLEMFEKAPRTVRDNIVQEFAYSPVDGMAFAVAWTIENAIRSRDGKIDISTNSVTAAEDGKYTVVFNAGGKTISSEWVNEYGIWRIRTFGDFAKGDKTMVEKRNKERASSSSLVTEPSIRVSANFALDLENKEPMLGLELKLGSTFVIGIQGFFGKDITQLEGLGGFTVPIPAGKAAFIPFGEVGYGMMFMPKEKEEDDFGSNFPEMAFGISLKGGLMFTTSIVPGLYLQAAYKHGFYMIPLERNGNGLPAASMLILGGGYSF
jgi:serine protease Do